MSCLWALVLVLVLVGRMVGYDMQSWSGVDGWDGELVIDRRSRWRHKN